MPRVVDPSRDDAILRDHLAGGSLREIGRAYGLSYETVRLAVDRAGRRYLDDLELRLLANTKTDELEAFLVPDHAGPDFDLAIEHLRWLLSQLAERGLKLKVHYRPVDNGVAFLLEDVTPYGRRGGD